MTDEQPTDGSEPGLSGRGGAAGPPTGRRWWTSRAAVTAASLAVLVAGVGLAVALTAGGNHPTTAHATTTVAPSTTAASGPPCPLTGLPSAGPVPARPAIAVKVDNYPDARPQSGLNQADVVFEEPVEGGITRYVAVFQCQDPSSVGPVRSARYPDVAIIDELSKPIFVHVGGIDPIQALIKQANDFDEDLYYDGSLAEHPAGRQAPYDTYINTQAVWGAYRQDQSPPAPIFGYSAAVPSGSPVASIHIPFSSSSDERWTWNATIGRWLLSYGGVPDMAAGGGQIATANVVVLSVEVTYGPWVENSQGALEVVVNPTSGGAAQVLRNGVDVTGSWARSSLASPIELTSASGSPIALQPGPTWVELVPSSIAVTTSPRAG